MNKQMPRILMVEDSASLAAVYQAYLQDDPYRVLTADSLGGARDALGSFQPDIVLLDIELPDGNGMDFLADVGQLRAPPRVIVMTAHGSSDLAEEAVRRGASDFLTKPFDAARLRVTLANAASRMQQDRRISELSSLERDRFGKFIGRFYALGIVIGVGFMWFFVRTPLYATIWSLLIIFLGWLPFLRRQGLGHDWN